MKKAVLFGAGQVGAMVLKSLDSSYKVVCFADNSTDKWGEEFLGIPVTSPDNCLAYDPEIMFLCVTGQDRLSAMRAQLDNLGYEGETVSTEALKIFDTRSATLRLLAEQINEYEIDGECAELGVYRGDFASLVNASFPKRRLYLFDTFEGFNCADIETEKKLGFSKANAGDFSETAETAVLEKLVYPEMAVFYRGWFPDTFTGLDGINFAFVSLDADLYAPTSAALPLFWEKMSPGGVIMVHDYNSFQFKGVKRAVDDFCIENKILPYPVPDIHGSCVLRK